MFNGTPDSHRDAVKVVAKNWGVAFSKESNKKAGSPDYFKGDRDKSLLDSYGEPTNLGMARV